MKFLKIFAMLILLSSPLLAFTDNLWITTKSTSGQVFVLNITSGAIVKTVNVGSFNIIGVDVSNESNPILSLLLKSGSNYFIKTYDDDFSPIATIELGTTAVFDVLRLSDSRYFVLADSSIREVDGSGSVLDTHSVHAGALTKITQYFVNGSNEFLVIARRDASTFPAGEVVGNVYNLTSDTQLNITFASAGSTKLECGYLKYNLTNTEMVWAVVDNGGGSPNYNSYAHSTFDPSTYEILVNISKFDLVTYAFNGYDNCWYSEKSNSFMLMNTSGEMKEVSDGIRNRDFNRVFDTFIYEIPSGYTVTSGVVEDVGVWFDTYEFSDFCGINSPVGNITCSITRGDDIFSCQTALTGNQSIIVNLTQIRPIAIFRPRVVVEFFSLATGEFFNVTNFTDWNVDIGSRNGWFALWNITGENVNANNETLRAGWVAYNSPISVLDIEDITMWYNSSSLGIGCDDGFFRTEWYVGYNLTHYLNRTSFCPVENFTIHDSYIDNNTLGVQAPIHFNTTSNRIITKIFVTTLTDDADFPVGSFVFVPPDMNITYFNIGRAVCTVGNIPSGNYDWTCNLNNSFQSLTGESFVSDSVVIVSGQNTTIQVQFERIKVLTLNISMIDANFDPVLNARCTNSLGSVSSQLCKIPTLSGFYGCCEFIGADVNTNYTTTIDPNRPNTAVVNTTFPTSDFYNSEGFSISPTCENFDGNYQYLWNIDLSTAFNVDFAVQDCDSGRAVAGATVQFENASCITQIKTSTPDNLNISLSWGTCRIRDVIFDYLPHSYIVSKRPYYEDRTETDNFLTQTPFFTCLERNSSRNDVNPEVAQTVQELGGADYSPIVSAMFDPTFIVVVMSFIIGGVITFYSGSGLVGLSSIAGFFMMFTWFGFLPLWIGLSMVMITGFLAVMTLRGVFSGG